MSVFTTDEHPQIGKTTPWQHDGIISLAWRAEGGRELIWVITGVGRTTQSGTVPLPNAQRFAPWDTYRLNMDTLVEMQRWLYGGMAQTMVAARDPISLQLLLVSAVAFGALHALMPGHGKSILVSYHLGRPGRLRDGLMTGTLLALTHIGSAVLLVLAGVAVISRTIAAGGRAPVFETASAAFIIVIGILLLTRTLISAHQAEPQDGRWLAVVTGLVPCPLTTFILAYALARGMLWVGIAAVAAMSVGVIFTLATFAVGAVYSRGRLLGLLARSEHWRQHVGQVLEIGGALAIIAIGLAMLLPKLNL